MLCIDRQGTVPLTGLAKGVVVAGTAGHLNRPVGQAFGPTLSSLHILFNGAVNLEVGIMNLL